MISFTSFLSITLGILLSLSVIYSGVGVARADSVIATIPVGGFPEVIAFDSANGNLYVLNSGNNTVSVIDGQTNAVVGNRIPVGVAPEGIAFDTANGNLYVTNGRSNTVSVIDGQTNAVVGSSIAAGDNPFGIAYDSSNHNLYVANEDSNAVSVISGQNNTVIKTIPVGHAPDGIAFDSANGNLYVTNRGDNTVSVIDGQTNAVVGNPILTRTQQPFAIAFDSANGNLYVTNFADNSVSVISGQTNAVIGSAIMVSARPYNIAFDSSNGNLYVTNAGDNTVSVISGKSNAVIGSAIMVGSDPQGIAIDSSNGNLYVTNAGDNTVSVISTTHPTSLTLNTIADVPSGTKVTVTGKLTDNGGVGVAGKSITFTGTGAGNIASVTTNPDGTFTASGISSNTVATGWTVQAHFAGDSLYAPADSSVQSYNTLRTTPPNTTITSAVDDNGVTITNGSTTFSGSIRFTFTAAAGTNPIAGFECSLDNGAFSSCSSPTTLTNLAVGKHTFQVRAVDTSGNKDPTPASFIWTIAAVTPPSHTTITSAVDGNGVTVQNGGTTVSTSIQFTFKATAGTNPIADFQCSLDNNPFSSCNSPTSLNNLATGLHKFTVVAVDSSGNKDPIPASFSWTILTPAQGIEKLIQTINGMHLNPGTQATLDTQLNGIMTTLSLPSNSNLPTACPHLNAFVSTVIPDYMHAGQLSPNQGAQIIQSAQNIEKALGCSVVNKIGALSASPSMQQSPALNLTISQQQQPQTTTSSPPPLQSQSPYPYTNQNPTLSQIPQSRSAQNHPVANAGNSQSVNENTKVELDGLASHASNGGTIVTYQWTQLPIGVPVSLSGANTATPIFTAPAVHTDTVLGFSLRVMDNHGVISTNPAVVYIMIKHNPYIGPTGSSNTPGTTIIQPQGQQLHQQIIPNNDAISPLPSSSLPQTRLPTIRNPMP